MKLALALATGTLALGACTSTTKPQAVVTTTATPPASVGVGNGKEVVYIYRSVQLLANSLKIDWSVKSIYISGSPKPSLSFFQGVDIGSKECWLKVAVSVDKAPAPKDSWGEFGVTIPVAVTKAQPSPWKPYFDDADPNTPGHWSLYKDQVTTDGTMNNTQAGKLAVEVLKATVEANGVVTVQPGSKQCTA